MAALPQRRFLRARMWWVLLCGVALAGSAAAGRVPKHESKHDARREIEALEEQWRMAQVSGDVAAIDRLMADDFVGISMTGQANTKAQQLDRFRTRSLVISKITLSDQKIKLVGAVAIVTGLADVEASNQGEEMKGFFRYTRVYQRVPPGAWKTTNFEATRVPPGQRR